MPTSSGMLKVGDLIQHVKSGYVVEVMERIGNDQSYSIRVRMRQRGPDGTEVPVDQTWLITEVRWWMQQGFYKLVDESILSPVHQCENMVNKDRWPYVRRCGREPATLRQVLVGKKAGTWDPIYEEHYVCDQCAKVVGGGE